MSYFLGIIEDIKRTGNATTSPFISSPCPLRKDTDHQLKQAKSMANQIIPHRYNGKQIEQLSEDGIIGGRLIPKGYCHATKLCKSAGKKLNDYLRLKRSKAYLNALSLDTGISVSNLVIELRGAPDGDASLQGTWVHPEIAKHLVDWVFNERITQTEKKIKNRLSEKLNGETEVLTPIGAIDVLTSKEIIEVKRVKNWKAALGQVLAYGYFYPSHQKRIHLFGKAHSVSVKHISSICQQYRVRVTWDT